MSLRLGRNKGAVLILILILVLAISAWFAGSFPYSTLKIEQDKITDTNLAKAREALIGDAVSQMPLNSAGYLRLPDLGFKIGFIPSEGSAAPNFTGNTKDYSVIGKFPWRTLGLAALHEGQGECLWYIVSGRFKNTPLTDVFNWDTQGQLDLVDGSGNVIATSQAALLVAAGSLFEGQNRALSDVAYTQCGGNYDARNYLDPFSIEESISGYINYFPNSINHRVAQDFANKRWVMLANSHFNDRFSFISTDEIFSALIHRADFSGQVSALLNDPYFRNVPIVGVKGSDSINCNQLASSNQLFCKNWREMLLLTSLVSPSPLNIDGELTANCSRVLLFGGRKTLSQLRLSPADKALPANYIENQNLSSFAAPVAISASFVGLSQFKADNSSADLLKCLP